ncbi:MAG: hypothetical protein JXM70_05110 [Pirellulales bacterium]|nr:hypothetical protein [Pirellulales bacterium]
MICLAGSCFRKRISLALAMPTILSIMSMAGMGQERDLYSDTWVATGALGRTLPYYDDVGGPREDRTVVAVPEPDALSFLSAVIAFGIAVRLRRTARG